MPIFYGRNISIDEVRMFCDILGEAEISGITQLSSRLLSPQFKQKISLVIFLALLILPHVNYAYAASP